MELAYACEQGIPWSRYIDTFDDEDRDHVLAHKIRESDRCPSCGRHHDEWTYWNEDLQAEMPIEPAPEFAHSHMCLSCAAIGGEEQSIRAQMPEGEDLPKGFSIRLFANTVANAKKFKRPPPR